MLLGQLPNDKDPNRRSAISCVRRNDIRETYQLVVDLKVRKFGQRRGRPKAVRHAVCERVVRDKMLRPPVDEHRDGLSIQSRPRESALTDRLWVMGGELTRLTRPPSLKAYALVKLPTRLLSLILTSSSRSFSSSLSAMRSSPSSFLRLTCA